MSLTTCRPPPRPSCDGRRRRCPCRRRRAASFPPTQAPSTPTPATTGGFGGTTSSMRNGRLRHPRELARRVAAGACGLAAEHAHTDRRERPLVLQGRVERAGGGPEADDGEVLLLGLSLLANEQERAVAIRRRVPDEGVVRLELPDPGPGRCGVGPLLAARPAPRPRTGPEASSRLRSSCWRRTPARFHRPWHQACRVPGRAFRDAVEAAGLRRLRQQGPADQHQRDAGTDRPKQGRKVKQEGSRHLGRLQSRPQSGRGSLMVQTRSRRSSRPTRRSSRSAPAAGLGAGAEAATGSNS